MVSSCDTLCAFFSRDLDIFEEWLRVLGRMAFCLDTLLILSDYIQVVYFFWPLKKWHLIVSMEHAVRKTATVVCLYQCG